MKIIFFSTKPYDKKYFITSNNLYNYDIRFIKSRLNIETVKLINNEAVICVFVNDTLDKKVLTALSQTGVKLIALRCAGYNNVDLAVAQQLGMTVMHVPAYSPNAVAEHTVCLMLSLNRKIHRAYSRVREGNFSLDGLLGFDFASRTLGIIGTGKIGSIVARIMKAMGMTVIAYDTKINPECEKMGVSYESLEYLLTNSDVISLHCPLTADTKHLINTPAINRMRPGVMLINTSRGATLDTGAVINGLKNGQIAYLGLDVYEKESDLFFEDLSSTVIQDDVFERLLTFPNVLITAHQGFFTSDALTNIANTTLKNISQFARGEPLDNKINL